MAANPNADAADAAPSRKRIIALGPRSTADRLALLHDDRGNVYVAYAPAAPAQRSAGLYRRDAIVSVNGTAITPGLPAETVLTMIRTKIEAGGAAVEVGPDPMVRTVTMSRVNRSTPFGLKLMDNKHGIVVIAVQPGSPAHAAGLRTQQHLNSVAGTVPVDAAAAVGALQHASLRVKVAISPHCDQARCLKVEVAAADNFLFCNACRIAVPKGARVQCCRLCDWDLCSKCVANMGPRAPTARVQMQSATTVSPGSRPSNAAPNAPTAAAAAAATTTAPAAPAAPAAMQPTSPPHTNTVQPASPSRNPVALSALAAVGKRREEREALAKKKAQEDRDRAAKDADLARKAIKEAQDRAQTLCNIDGCKIVCTGSEYTTVPDAVVIGYARETTALELSFNVFTSLRSVRDFKRLEELVVDNNRLESPLQLPPLPKLRVLSLNNNRITDLHGFVGEVKRQCPSLEFLSVLNNAACPSELEHCTAAEYELYRLYIIKMLPRIKFLDSKEVTASERAASNARFEFAAMPLIRPIKEVMADVKHGTIKVAGDIKKGAGKGLVRAKSITTKIARDGLRVMNR